MDANDQERLLKLLERVEIQVMSSMAFLVLAQSFVKDAKEGFEAPLHCFLEETIAELREIEKRIMQWANEVCESTWSGKFAEEGQDTRNRTIRTLLVRIPELMASKQVARNGDASGV